MQKKYHLDLSSLQKASTQLADSLRYYYSDMVQRDPGLALQLRAAAIQAFEYTYELSHKFLKRYLEMSEPSAAVVETMSFPDLIRTASERELLLHDWSMWMKYRTVRNMTSHTYNEEKAKQALEIIPEFLEETQYLLTQLIQRINQP